MKYELKGELLTLALESMEQYERWHYQVLATLKELDPRITGYIRHTHVWIGGEVAGAISKEDLSPHWKRGSEPNYWYPNRRYNAGKRASNVIAAMPPEPDFIEDCMKMLGFKERFLGFGKAPGYAIYPRLQRAFLVWGSDFPEVNHPDLVEVLESEFKKAAAENEALREAEVAV